MTAPASAATTPQQLGGLDIGAYCRSIGYTAPAGSGRGVSL
ncbi:MULTISPECIES: hypothetical protein [unclassified Actinoplanes]|nr:MULTISPECIES: hypothetical protein [unclassified Actinoplanes]